MYLIFVNRFLLITNIFFDIICAGGENMTINRRFKQVRKALGLTQKKFCVRLGIDQSTLSQIENGVIQNVNERNIALLCKEFGVNEHWLRHGEGEMFSNDAYLLELLGRKLDNLDELDKKIITEYLKLNDSQRKVIKEFIKKLF